MARMGLLPEPLSHVLPKRRTPWVAIIASTLVAIALTFTGTLAALAETVVLLLLFVFLNTNLAVLVLRRDIVAEQHFRVPTWVPVLAIVSCLILLCQQGLDTLWRADAAGHCAVRVHVQPLGDAGCGAWASWLKLDSSHRGSASCAHRKKITASFLNFLPTSISLKPHAGPLAAKVLAATGDVEMVQMLLGHACLSHTKPYLTVDQGTLRRAFELAL
ncbi:hypothetical protein ALP50_200215 [Pseudomonas syringae pv. spinaceae]|nr:hypothetical protein ALP50_200215 [Pseudomonas syringae pv. spinaceae]